MLSEKKKNLTLVSVIFTVVGVSFHLILRLVLLVRAWEQRRDMVTEVSCRSEDGELWNFRGIKNKQHHNTKTTVTI